MQRIVRNRVVSLAFAAVFMLGFVAGNVSQIPTALATFFNEHSTYDNGNLVYHVKTDIPVNSVRVFVNDEERQTPGAPQAQPQQPAPAPAPPAASPPAPPAASKCPTDPKAMTFMGGAAEHWGYMYAVTGNIRPGAFKYKGPKSTFVMPYYGFVTMWYKGDVVTWSATDKAGTQFEADEMSFGCDRPV